MLSWIAHAELLRECGPMKTTSALILAALACLIAPLAAADGTIIPVDGDTVTRAGVRYRLLGYDTPELRGRCPAETALAQAATERLRALIAAARTVELRGNGVRDRYGRTLAALMLDGRDAGEALIREGLAREYRGGQRQPWCP